MQTPLKAILITCYIIVSFQLAFAECEIKVPNAKATLDNVSSRYTKVSSLKANFEQTSFFLGLGDTVKSSGNLAFKRPGRMDWAYKNPQPQRFIADGERVWFYQPDLNQVTVGEFKKAFSSDIPVTFLLGVGELTNSFDLKKACNTQSRYEFFLKPKQEDPNLKEFVLFVDPATLLPKGAKVIDVGGNETEIVLDNINTNTSLKDSDFTFVIPKGVDVIDQSMIIAQ